MLGVKKEEMWLVAGLGNPGLQYEKTRHNAGFAAADRLAAEYSVSFNKHKFEAEYGEMRIDGKRVLLVKPQTYMNNSGRAVSAISHFYKIPPENIIIIFDDITQPVGKIRIRRGGSHGGHNGMRDITELMGTDLIKRIKVGVSERPDRTTDLKDWVLGRVPAEQQPRLEAALERAAAAVTEIITRGIDSAMNKYNG